MADIDAVEVKTRSRKGKQRYISLSDVSSYSDVAVDAMEVQSQLFAAARCVQLALDVNHQSDAVFSKHSLEEIAATNPGDGIKCLYGETTFIIWYENLLPLQ